MKFYRCEVFDALDDGESAGFLFASSKAEMLTLIREHNERHAENNPSRDNLCTEPEAIDIEPTKAGILRALRRYAGHPDNG